MTYTSHGLMTAADLEEYRQDTDWYELNPPEPSDDGCVHGRLLTEDCGDCETECAECPETRPVSVESPGNDGFRFEASGGEL